MKSVASLTLMVRELSEDIESIVERINSVSSYSKRERVPISSYLGCDVEDLEGAIEKLKSQKEKLQKTLSKREESFARRLPSM